MGGSAQVGASGTSADATGVKPKSPPLGGSAVRWFVEIKTSPVLTGFCETGSENCHWLAMREEL
ncbi:MAG: hypothetical protein C5B49_04050 [Bdellovibrio sp.]|nr:MAG: hypothetical protein C5B49_04050 [Bdellovibrio sp.]